MKLQDKMNEPIRDLAREIFSSMTSSNNETYQVEQEKPAKFQGTISPVKETKRIRKVWLKHDKTKMCQCTLAGLRLNDK